MSAYSDKVIADGAVAYWRLDEASGNALSLVGNYPGTVSGGVTRSQPGALADGNTAMAFDGTTGYIEVADAPGLHFTTVVTMEAWIRLSSLIGASLIVVTKGRGGYAFSYGLVIQTGRVGYRWNNGDYVTTAELITANEWHHVVVIANESAAPNVTVYVNGVQYTGGFTGATPTGDFIYVTNFPLGIGYLWDALSAEHFNGQIDEVAIYHIALTPAQIATHYALGTDTGQPAPYAAVYLPAADRPFNQWQPLTPSDQTDRPFASLWCGQAGTVAAVMQDGVVGSFTVPAGALVPIMGRRVNATGTSVTSILALGTV